MTHRLIRKTTKSADGYETLTVTPADAGWKYVGFEYHHLPADKKISGSNGDRELCLVVITGTVTVESGGQKWEKIGKRQTVFNGEPPYALYLPKGAEYEITAEGPAEVGLCFAPAANKREPLLMTPETLKINPRGKGTNTRHICDVMMGNNPAESLLVTEVRTPSGHWSSYPPHKHDQDNLPHESYLEETYFHKINPEQGFILQRVYTDDRSLDEAICAYNNEVVLVPCGYHPVSAPYGYDSYYLNVMAGPRRQWVFHNDPDHEWIFQRDAK